MPVKLSAKTPPESEARIEIIPLIDIMFFLLASFMLVSLSMVHLKTVPLELPQARSASASSPKHATTLSMDASGQTFLEQRPVGFQELATQLRSQLQTEPQLQVLIRADRATRHGDVLHLLDQVRTAGIQRVAFEVQSTVDSKPASP